jgi:hypothetical protein
MTQPHQHTGDAAHGSHRGHGLMMIACCIPMLVIAVALVATGVVSFGFLFIAVACTALMVLMMRGMGGMGGMGNTGGNKGGMSSMGGMHGPTGPRDSSDDHTRTDSH